MGSSPRLPGDARPVPENGTVRRAELNWLVGFALLIAAFFGVVWILNATVYSAHGFVSSYLDALNRHDATTARELPGVRAPKGAATNLLTDGALGTVADIHLVHDTAGSGGVHDVEYSYVLGKQADKTTFAVKETSSFLGLFSRWEFTTSPLATVAVGPLHDPRFLVGTTGVVTKAKSYSSSSYAVFAPEVYTFSHRSTYLVAAPIQVPVSEPGSVNPVQVDIVANKTFVADVRVELDQYFAKCATQKVLLPTSCPFGKSFSNRVISTPVWSITKDPPITIVPNGDDGDWLVPYATGEVHLKVKVQSLFDGSVSTFDSDIPFGIKYTITVGEDDHLTITALVG
jgi:hypothetical protein